MSYFLLGGAIAFTAVLVPIVVRTWKLDRLPPVEIPTTPTALRTVLPASALLLWFMWGGVVLRFVPDLLVNLWTVVLIGIVIVLITVAMRNRPSWAVPPFARLTDDASHEAGARPTAR